jgi:ribosomal protein S18 acetylase RimI-like enzyme
VEWRDAARVRRAAVRRAGRALPRALSGATLDIVEIDGEPGGRLYVHRGPRDTRIMDIALVPAFRGHGIGSELLHGLIDEVGACGKTLSIHVEANNPARRLYERLGFRPSGEHGVYVLMKRLPG